MESSERRVACLANLQFQLRVLEPIASAFDHSLISYDVSEVEAWCPDVIVVADSTLLPKVRDYCDARNVMLIGLRHGVVNKYTFPANEYSCADYICGSEWDKTDFESKGVFPRRSFLITGNPWVDGVFRIPRRTLNTTSPTILFAPTYNPETSAAAFFHHRLLDLIRAVYPDSWVIIKPHPGILEYDNPLVVRHKHVFQDWICYWRKIAQEPGVVFIDDPRVSIARLYDRADILISDGSSVIFEFMALNRPILLYNSRQPIANCKNDFSAPGYAWRDVGCEFSTEDDFLASLSNVFRAHQDKYGAKQREYTRRLYGQFQDGRSVERVVEAIRGLPFLDVLLLARAEQSTDCCATSIRSAIANTRTHVLEYSEGIVPEKLIDFANVSRSEYIMPIIVREGDIVKSATFVTRSFDSMVRDSQVAVAGRVTEPGYSIFRASALRTLSGVSSNRELLSLLEEQGYRTVCTLDDRPTLQYETGFHKEENGGRWMSQEGTISIVRAIENERSPKEFIVRFELTCGDTHCYDQFPFEVHICAGMNNQTVTNVRFDRPHQTVSVEVQTRESKLCLRSEQSFIPAALGINGDPRVLSVRLSNASVEELPANDNKVRLIAFYLPQYHRIPENDKWWGEGFTEWTNVAKSQPLFDGHYQPHVPGELGYYNLLDPQVQIAQAELAKAYGIEGFCYWHYWFNGKRLLEKPLEQVLESGWPEFPFCLAWANESWTRAWDGRSDEVLQEQVYGGEEDDRAHFQYLVRAFMDRRYIRIDGKPLFLIYRPADLPNSEQTVSLWKKLARDSGLEGLYLVAIRTSFDSTPENHWLNYGFDAELYFQPDFKAIWDQFGTGKLTGTKLDISGGEPGLVVAYQDAWHVMANSGHSFYRTVVPCWDNSPRKRSPFILAESSPEEYQKWLNIEVERVLHRSPDQRIVFVNAWNEWGEGNHLEPDTRFGRGYLEATRRAVVSANISVLRGEGKLKEAISNLETLVSADPEYAQGYNDLGVLLYESGDLERAIECLQRAAELDPKDIDCWRNLVDAYLANHQFADARSACQQLLSLEPSDVESASLLRYINELCCDDTAVPSVSIIIPVFNNLELTQKCLESISRNTDYSDYEVVIVDNASTDDTADWLRSIESPKIRCVYNPRNMGFVGACNAGAKHARGEYILFLNNDTLVQPGWLRALIDFADKTPDCGAVGSKLVYPDGTLQEAGGIVFSDGEAWNYGRGLNPDDPKYNFVREVDYCSGAALMVRRSLWNAIGGFDEQYSPGYYEDTDLCFKIRTLGYKVYYQPKSVVVHYEGQTAGRSLASGMKRYQLRNKNLFFEKWSSVLESQYSHAPENVLHASDRGARRSIIVIDASLPMFDRASGSLRLYNILKLLKQLDFHITFLARNGSLEADYRPHLEDLGIEVYAWDRAAMESVGCNVQTIPYLDYRKLLGERKFDFALIEFWPVAEYYIPIIRALSPDTRIIVDTVDLHFVREMREAEVKGDPELIEPAESKKHREIAVYRQSDGLWVVTDQEYSIVKDLVDGVRIDVVPNIHSLTVNTKCFDDSSDLLFVGNFSHPPNVDALLYFCQEIYPRIRVRLPDVKLYVVGNNPPPEIRALASEQVIVTGYVKDLSPYLKNARISVAPLRYGAGMKGKIGEALSWGLPVVTTTVGAEGMDLFNNEHVMIADDPELFADSVVRLYTDRDLWERLSQNGKAKVMEWSPDRVKARLASIFAADKSEIVRGLTSIVILTHNQLDYTKRCLESIAMHTPEAHELIVVDNASTDGTVEYLKAWVETHPQHRVIFNEENKGFSAGNNQGIGLARGEYIMVLNNDTVVTPGWLGRLLKCANTSPKIGIVGPVTNEISGIQKVESVGYDLSDLAGLNEFSEEWSSRHSGQRLESWRVVGFCMLIKRSVIDKIGGFDSRFGLGNFEDDDFCIRANLAGFSCTIAKDCFIHHFGSRTFAGNGIDHQRLLLHNWEIFKRKWGLPSTLQYGTVYSLSGILAASFDHTKHYCSLLADDHSKWFAMPDWDQRETWEPVIFDYIGKYKRGDGSILLMYAGHRTNSTPEKAYELVRSVLEEHGIDIDNCPDIEITNEISVDDQTLIVTTGREIDKELLERFVGCSTRSLTCKVAA